MSRLNSSSTRVQSLPERSEKSYQIIFENTGAATVILEDDMTVSLVNSAFERISGYSKAEVEGRKNWSEFISKDHIERVKEYHRLRRFEPGKAPAHYETQFIDRFGVVKELYMTADLIPETRQSVLSMLDITEHKQRMQETELQQQQLIQADKMATLGILVSGVAHEINNPNNYLMLNAKIIDKAWKDISPILKHYYEVHGDFALAGMPYTRSHEKIAQLITGLFEGSSRIQKIVQSLKDYARQDTGDLTQRVNVNTVVESAIVIVNNLIKKSTNRFSIGYGTHIPEIRGNPQYLEQVIINLITNACQALVGKQKRLAVSTGFDARSNRVIMKVCDEGIGIPKADLQHILDPFFTTKRRSGGTGLGLAISYRIVKDHGGDLVVTSQRGKGTTVTVYLPAKSEEENA